MAKHSWTSLPAQNRGLRRSILNSLPDWNQEGYISGDNSFQSKHKKDGNMLANVKLKESSARSLQLVYIYRTRLQQNGDVEYNWLNRKM